MTHTTDSPKSKAGGPEVRSNYCSWMKVRKSIASSILAATTDKFQNLTFSRMSLAW